METYGGGVTYTPDIISESEANDRIRLVLDNCLGHNLSCSGDARKLDWSEGESVEVHHRDALWDKVHREICGWSHHLSIGKSADGPVTGWQRTILFVASLGGTSSMLQPESPKTLCILYRSMGNQVPRPSRGCHGVSVYNARCCLGVTDKIGDRM